MLPRGISATSNDTGLRKRGLFTDDGGFSERSAKGRRGVASGRGGHLADQLGEHVDQFFQTEQVAILVIASHPRLVVVYLHGGWENVRFAKVYHPNIGGSRPVVHK